MQVDVKENKMDAIKQEKCKIVDERDATSHETIEQVDGGTCFSFGDRCYNSAINNYAEAIKWYRKAAEQGYAVAQNNLGNCYFNGYRVDQDCLEAAKWYSKITDCGNATIRSNLDDYSCYEAISDYEKAIEHCVNDAEQGNIVAQNSLGNYHYDVAIFKYGESIRWYRQAAEQGHAVAQSNLNRFICNSASHDYVEAIKWYRKATEQGYAVAQSNLGNCYYYGNGVERNCVEAFKWYHLAGQQGYHSCRYNSSKIEAFFQLNKQN